uniref:Uncharacterized protein n=1 Tax=Rousettus aegyptiacus TaxID=9407 RepID=A0A7J8C2Z3_ROUAE|nr:hypothetical protein HJG63_009493 [Rousettus aegyptiacus]
MPRALAHLLTWSFAVPGVPGRRPSLRAAPKSMRPATSPAPTCSPAARPGLFSLHSGPFASWAPRGAGGGGRRRDSRAEGTGRKVRFRGEALPGGVAGVSAWFWPGQAQPRRGAQRWGWIWFRARSKLIRAAPSLLPRWPRDWRGTPGPWSCQTAKTGKASGVGPGQVRDARAPTQSLRSVPQGLWCLSAAGSRSSHLSSGTPSAPPKEEVRCSRGRLQRPGGQARSLGAADDRLSRLSPYHSECA